MRREERGRVLYEGKKGIFSDSIGVQIVLFLFLLGLVVFMLLVASFSFLGQFHILGSNLLAGFAALLVCGLLLLVMDFVGFETDRIYEKGITNGATLLVDFLRKRSYQPFDEIGHIGVGRVTIEGYVEDSEFLVPFDRRRGQMLRPFIEKKYVNDFYPNLVSVLRFKCPKSRWVQVQWDDMQRR